MQTFYRVSFVARELQLLAFADFESSEQFQLYASLDRDFDTVAELMNAALPRHLRVQRGSVEVHHVGGGPVGLRIEPHWLHLNVVQKQHSAKASSTSSDE